MLNIYLGCASLVFIFLTFIWSTRNAKNIMMKMVLFIMSMSSIFLLLQNLGYIVKL